MSHNVTASKVVTLIRDANLVPVIDQVVSIALAYALKPSPIDDTVSFARNHGATVIKLVDAINELQILDTRYVNTAVESGYNYRLTGYLEPKTQLNETVTELLVKIDADKIDLTFLKVKQLTKLFKEALEC